MMHRLAEKEQAVSPLLTDMYQITMAYTYWKTGRHCLHSTFDLYFRKAPFGGSYALFAGLQDCLRFVSYYRFTQSEVDYVKSVIPSCDQEFLQWLLTVNCASVTIHAFEEGSVVFPSEPMLRVSGPLAVVQLLETTLLNMVNYASLMATNAHRFRIAAGPEAKLFEFGLRRAQGPDGAMSASRYSMHGGFDGTSNVAAGFQYGIPVFGTHAHSYVQSFCSLSDCFADTKHFISSKDSEMSSQAFRDRVTRIRDTLDLASRTSDGELAAFISYAFVHPSSFLALVDTYDTIESGVPNFMCVAFALFEMNHQPIGIRLDSGDLGCTSVKAHSAFHGIAEMYVSRFKAPRDGVLNMVSKLSIVASDEISVPKLLELRSMNHEITAFGIGTHLVTCREQPALGCVFKLSSVQGKLRMKLSEDPAKASIPGEKVVYRLYDQHNKAFGDVLALSDDKSLRGGESVELRRRQRPENVITVVPHRIRKLLQLVWCGEPDVKQLDPQQYIKMATSRMKMDVDELDSEVVGVVCEPKEYPVFITSSLYQAMRKLQCLIEIRNESDR
ncbi:Nicotinate phosphoribosyltransferase 1 [Gracilariopsis chorda]|uniref:Nicotinate phosphoribosyltransferase n=1 Tax=Gracilariopsis chorda TaxID=448386 RepID=A0A2V3INY6_9FLOR|nr:Nicotinate phosphoribosyltransferase 1 [Gracilariopsis chorda]|eukprot:PXF42840.1 Nicotinate phosphoribosyltransferase 1 [Gracilariopsis chorda]